MPKVIIDTTDVKDGDFPAYTGPTPPAGLYKAIFKRGWWTKSSSGKPMLKMVFELGTTNEEKKQYNGYAVWHNITNEPSTAWKMKELFTALGTGAKSGIDFDDQGVVSRIGSAVPGKAELLIKGKHDTYNGSTRLIIDTLAPLPNTVQTDDEEADESSFAADETFSDGASMDAASDVPF